jgi:hypothetical protein
MMGRIQNIMLWMALMCTTASAQVFDGIGLKGGINYSKISESESPPGSSSFITRISIGVFGDMELLNYLFLRYEVFYAVKGTSRAIEAPVLDGNTATLSWDFTTIRTLAYIEPVFVAHVVLRETKGSRYHVFAGASLAVNVRASSSSRGFYLGEPFREVHNERGHFLPIDPGLIIGTGYDFRFHSSLVTAEIRYVHGLMNIWDRGAPYLPAVILDRSDVPASPMMHNRTISLLIGLRI